MSLPYPGCTPGWYVAPRWGEGSIGISVPRVALAHHSGIMMEYRKVPLWNAPGLFGESQSKCKYDAFLQDPLCPVGQVSQGFALTPCAGMRCSVGTRPAVFTSPNKTRKPSRNHHCFISLNTYWCSRYGQFCCICRRYDM